MNVYVFEWVDQVSGREHAGGGLLIVAKSVERAKEMIADETYVDVTDEEWAKVIVIKSYVKSEERLIAFPDAGCC